jgi:hypothetical protein
VLIQAQLGAILAGVGDAKFVGATTRSGPGAVTFPAGAVAGDLAMIVVTNNGATTQSGWSVDTIQSGSTYLNVHTKVLSAGDLSSPPTVASAIDTVHVLVWNGVSAATLKTTGTSGASDSTLAIDGFTKSGPCRAIVNVAADRGSSAGSPPAAFTSRSSSVPGSLFACNIADLVLLPNYVDEADFVWTGFSAVTYSQIGMAYELT